MIINTNVPERNIAEILRNPMFFSCWMRMNELEIDNEHKNAVIVQLDRLLNLENQVLDQLKAERPNYKHDYANSDISNQMFAAHEQLITSAYGEADPLTELSLDAGTLAGLQAHLDGLDQIKLSSVVDEGDCNGLLYKLFLGPEKVAKIDENLTYFDFKNSPWFQGFLKAVRAHIAAHIRSPFSIVNMRGWITRPNADRWGSNGQHMDGFKPGHMKMMIYMQPMDVEHGYFTVNDHEVSGRGPGICLLFKNSDFMHSGVPGTVYPRASLELTIHRTFLDYDATHDGHPYGRHYQTLNSAYALAGETVLPQADAADAD